MKTNTKKSVVKTLGYESDDSMEFFPTDLTHHDYEIAIEYPHLLEGQYGLKACIDIKKGKLIGIFGYAGDKLSDINEVQRRLELPPPHCIIALDTVPPTWLDFRNWINIEMKYINHSCIDNNCELVFLNSKIVGVISKRKIKCNEFFHYDYNLHYIGSHQQNSIQGTSQSKCLCYKECQNYI